MRPITGRSLRRWTGDPEREGEADVAYVARNRSGDRPELAPFNALAMPPERAKLEGVENTAGPDIRSAAPREHLATATI